MEIRRANGMLVGSRGKLPTRKGQLLLRHLTIITRSRDTAQHTNKYHFHPPPPEIPIHLPARSPPKPCKDGHLPGRAPFPEKWPRYVAVSRHSLVRPLFFVFALGTAAADGRVRVSNFVFRPALSSSRFLFPAAPL